MALSPISDIEASAQITEAIKKASKETGTDFDYLLKTAARESNFETRAKARSSSAAGLFQFIEGTWLQMVKTVGHRFGLGHMADKIIERKDGSYDVADAKTRKQVLQLRYDPEVSALMAGAFTRQNADYVRARLGREPTKGELYIAHFLGARKGTRLIELAQKEPDGRADIHFSRAAKANPSIFYSNGRPRSLSEVHQRLVSRHDGPALAVAPAVLAEVGTRAQPIQRVPALPPEALAELQPLTEVKAEPLPRQKLAALAPEGIKVTDADDAGLGTIGVWKPITKAAPRSEDIQALPFEVEDLRSESKAPVRRVAQRQVQNPAPANPVIPFLGELWSFLTGGK